MSASPEFEAVLSDLRDVSRPFSLARLYQLSDLAKPELAALEAALPDLPEERRLNVMRSLAEISDSNFEVSFDSVFELGLEDEAPEVRAAAISALWESEDPRLAAPFIDFLLHDPHLVVRAAAATALGRFVYLGEIEEIAPAIGRRVEDTLLAVIGGPDDLEVRRRALEAVAFSGRPEVPPLIEAAYTSGDHRLRVSALHAMGRNADAERWAAPVQAELESGDAEIGFEAVRAAGELELRSAGPTLARLATAGDDQIREAAIWSLSQIGGDPARQALARLLEQSDDPDQQEYIQEALDNLDFTDEVNRFSLFELGEVDGGDEEDFIGDDGLWADEAEDEDDVLDAEDDE